MDNRERILDLVSKGVLSVEEGLDLLESLSNQEAKKTEEQEFTSEESKKTAETVKAEPVEEEVEEIEEEPEKYEDELEMLANQINQYSVGIDLLNKEIVTLKSERVEWVEKLKSEEDAQTRTDLENKINKMNTELEKLRLEKDKRMKDMHSLKMQRWTSKAKQFSGNLDIPKEWRTGASETIDKAGEIFESGSQTLAELLRETVKKTKDTVENIDWKDMKFDFSMKEEASFEHEWLFENTSASIIDFKNAKGDIEFKPSFNDNIKIQAKIQIYEKFEELTPLEAFEARTIMNIDEDNFTFHIPNKNIKADLIVYLPKRNYDYIRLNTFAGDITFNELLARDIYIKVTSGDVLFKKLEASMLEIDVSNGDVTLEDNNLRDLLLSMVNGDLRVVGEIQSLEASTVNGDIRLTLSGADLIRVVARSVKGDLKVSLPEEVSLEIESKTTLGEIKSRLSGTEQSKNEQTKGQSHRFYRIAQGALCRANLQTTTGNILLKDTDKE